MTGRERVLVVGSYPPIPLPASEATLAAVRRAWQAGNEVVIASPRVSAAPVTLRLTGVLGGRRLDAVRRRTRATRLVLVFEDGFPLRANASAVTGFLEARALARAMDRFEHVTAVRVGDPGIPDRSAKRVFSAATTVVDHPAERGPVPDWARGVTPLGPVETLPRERARMIARSLLRLTIGEPGIAALKRRLKR